MRVFCEVEETDLENDHGQIVPGVVVTCSECEHKVESFGTGAGSIRRYLALLREECPLRQENY